MKIKHLIRYIPIFSQDTLQLTRRCNLSCITCALWKLPPSQEPPIKLKNKQLKKTYHLVGGEPFLSQKLQKLLLFLKKKKCTVKFWTNGQFSLDKWATLLPFIDTIFFYLPAADADTYRIITSDDGYEDVMEKIDYLKSEEKNVIINVPIQTDMIDLLPDIHALAIQKKCTLLLHYCPKEAFTKDQVALINRYRRIHNVQVFENHFPNAQYCVGYVDAVVHDKKQILQNWFEKVITSFYSLLDHREHKR